MKLSASSLASVAAAFALSTSSAISAVVYDSLSNISLLYPAIDTSINPGGSVGNRYLGGALNLANFTPGDVLTGMNLRLNNQSGDAIVAAPVRLNVWLWNSVPLTAGGRAFSNQVGIPGAPTAVVNLGNISLSTNSSTPISITFDSPPQLNPTSGNTIGITLNYEIFEGGSWVSRTSFNSGVVGGGSQTPPAIGSNALRSAPNYAFFRSVNTATDTTGNFSSNSSRNIGVNSGLPIMLFGGPAAVPEPATAASSLLLSLAGLSLVSRRKRKA